MAPRHTQSVDRWVATGVGGRFSRAAKLARILAEHCVVVSGLAEGIDSAAHRAAIDSNGRTIAVFGTPLDECYPRKNADLQAEIASRHLLVSQIAPRTAVRRQNFPIRKRTMALLADASVTVEAGETSGSLSQGGRRFVSVARSSS